LDRLELICQIYDSDHGIMITLYKDNQNKLWKLIFNQPNIEGQNWKKLLNKKDIKPI